MELNGNKYLAARTKTKVSVTSRCSCSPCVLRCAKQCKTCSFAAWLLYRSAAGRFRKAQNVCFGTHRQRSAMACTVGKLFRASA